MFVVSSDFSRTHSPDTPGYMELAENYQAVYIESDPKFVNSSLLRTPGYPTLLAISQTNGKQHQWIILILQMLISIGTISLVYYFAKYLLGKPAALIAALLLTIDPVSLTYIYYLRNEVLFTFLLVAGTGLWLLCIQKVNFPQMAFVGFIIGLATLTRPVSLYLPLFLIAGILVLVQAPFSRRLLLSSLLIIGFMLPVGGWMVRNKSLSGSGMLSSIQGINILYYRAAGAIAEETGKSRRAVEFELKEMMTDKYNLNLSQWRTEPNPGRINQLNQQEGLQLLLAHPKGMVISSIKGCGRLLFGPGTTALQTTLGINPHNNLQKYLFKGVVTGITLFISFAAMWGTGIMIRNRLWPPLLSLATIIVYFVIISSGPEAHSRFRAPIMPFFCLLAGYGISASINRKKSSHKKLSLIQTQQMSSRTRILYVIDTLEVGGTERSLLQICTHLDRSKFEPIVVSLYEGSTLQEQFESHGIEVHSVNLKGKYQFYTAWTQLKKLILDLKPDIVHTMLFRADQVGRVAAWWMRCIVVSSFVNIPYKQINPQSNSEPSDWKRKAIQKIDKYTSRFVTQFHAVSGAVKQRHCQVLQIPEDGVTVIPRGRNTSLFSTFIQKEKLALKKQLEITGEKQVIINVGRLTPQKGQSVLIDAMQTIVKQKQNIVLLIAGEGAFRESLQHQIDSLKLSNRIRLLGQVENIPLLLSIADCFAFPSFYEGLPGSVIEAMFAGCPIVASDIPMIRELIEDHHSGLLVEKGESKPLAEGILKLLDDQTIAHSYGERARTVAKSQFSIQQVVRQTESFYLDVISKYEKEPS